MTEPIEFEFYIENEIDDFLMTMPSKKEFLRELSNMQVKELKLMVEDEGYYFNWPKLEIKWSEHEIVKAFLSRGEIHHYEEVKTTILKTSFKVYI